MTSVHRCYSEPWSDTKIVAMTVFVWQFDARDSDTPLRRCITSRIEFQHGDLGK